MCDERCPVHRAGRGETYEIIGPSRRQFIAQSTLAAIVALLTTACGDGEIGGVGPPAPEVLAQGFTIRISDFPALQQVGGIARVDGNTSNPLAVSRLGPSTFAALSMICPHAGYKPISIVSSGFRCPRHMEATPCLAAVFRPRCAARKSSWAAPGFFASWAQNQPLWALRASGLRQKAGRFPG